MARTVLFGVGALAAVLAVVGWRLAQAATQETLVETRARPPEAAPFCPWREPQADLQRLFPTATRHETETRILSGRRLELTRRLGRAPTGDENALHLYRIYRDNAPLGTIVTQRVKVGDQVAHLAIGVDHVADLHELAGGFLELDGLRG